MQCIERSRYLLYILSGVQLELAYFDKALIKRKCIQPIVMRLLYATLEPIATYNTHTVSSSVAYTMKFPWREVNPIWAVSLKGD